MNNQNFNIWDDYPRYLTPAEVENPMQVLSDFFSGGWLQDHLDELRQWRNYVVKNEYYVDGKGSPASLYFICKSVLALIDAAYLLNQQQRNNTSKESTNAQFCHTDDRDNVNLKAEKQAWEHYPIHLNEGEIGNPYSVISEFFQSYSLCDYRQQLDLWLEAGLSNSDCGVSPSAYDLVMVYDLLQKLFEATYVILQRYYVQMEEEAAQETVQKSHIMQIDEASNNPASKAASTIPGFFMSGRFYTGYSPEGRLGLSVLINVIKREVPSVRLVVYMGIHLPLPTYYLLVIVDGKDRSCEGELCSRMEAATRKITPLFTLVHKTGSFESAVKDVNRFFNNVLNLHPVVYQHPAYVLPGTVTFSREVIKDKSTFYWNRWGELGKAFLDQAVMTLLLDNQLLTLHLLDQAVAHILSGVIRVKLGYKTGNLSNVRLFQLTQIFTEDLLEIFVNGDAKCWELYKLLQVARMQTQYRDKVKIDSTLLIALADQVCLLYSNAKRIYADFNA